jgi:hypothetical protein
MSQKPDKNIHHSQQFTIFRNRHITTKQLLNLPAFFLKKQKNNDIILKGHYIFDLINLNFDFIKLFAINM